MKNTIARSQATKDSDIKVLFNKVLKNIHYLIGSVVICLIIAFFYNRMSIPRFRISSQLIVRENDRNSMDPSRFMKGSELLFSARNNFDNELLILQSTANITQTLKSVNQEVSYFIRENLQLVEIYRTSPFIVVFDKNHPQIVDAVFKIEIEENNIFTITAKHKEASLYSFVENKSIDIIDDFKIDKQHSFNDEIRDKNLSFKIMLNKDFVLDPKHKNIYYFKISSLQSLTSYYKDRIKIDPVSLQATAVNITIEDKTPEKLLDFTRELVTTCINNNLEKKNNITRNTIAYIDGQLSQIHDSLKLSENVLQNFRSSNQVVDITLQSESIYAQLRELETLKAAMEVNSKYYTYIIDYLQKSEDVSDMVVPSSIGIAEPLLNNLITELIALNAERNNLINNNQQRSPYLKTIEIKIKNIKNTITENINYVQNTNNLSLEDMDKKINSLHSEIQKIPKAQRELVGYERTFKLNDAIYTYLMEKRAEASIAQAQEMSDYELVEAPAIIAMVAPKKMRNYFMAVFVGLLIPALFFMLLDLYKDDLKDKEEIMSLTSLPIVGEIVHNEIKHYNVFQKAPKSIISETFRSLRTNLKYFAQGKKCTVILITSSIGSEGKSFCAYNIATSLAQLGSRTLLMEFDLRLPGLHSYFPNSNHLGITSVLTSESAFQDTITTTDVENLLFMASGSTPPNPSELIASENTHELFRNLREQFKYIIIDTPPAGIITDAKLLFDLADIKLYVVRQNYTPKKIFASTVKDIELKVHTNIGIIINDIKVSKRESGYGYGYKYYTDGTKKKKSVEPVKK